MTGYRPEDLPPANQVAAGTVVTVNGIRWYSDGVAWSKDQSSTRTVPFDAMSSRQAPSVRNSNIPAFISGSSDCPTAAQFGPNICLMNGALSQSDGTTTSPAPAGFSLIYNVSPYVSGVKDSWKNSVASILSGSNSRASIKKMLMLGDSTTTGVGAGTTDAYSNQTNARKFSLPVQIAEYLSSRGVRANGDNFFGQQLINIGGSATPAAYSLYDPRVTFTGAPALFNVGGIGVYAYDCQSTDTIAFNPGSAVTWDTVEVYMLDNPGVPNITVTATGLTGTITSTSTGLTRKATFTATRSSNMSVTLSFAAGGHNYIFGIICYDSQNTPLSIISGGTRGADTGYITNSGTWSVPLQIAALAPDIISFEYGINDQAVPVNKATFKSNINQVITAAIAANPACKFVFIGNNQTSTGTSAVQYEQYYSALKELAETNSAPFIDTNSAFGGTLLAAQSYGYMFSDSIHPSRTGYGRLAKIVGDLIASA